MNADLLFVRDFPLVAGSATTPQHVLVISRTDDPTTDLERARAALDKGAQGKAAKALAAATPTLTEVPDFYGAATIVRRTEGLIGLVDLTLDAKVGDRLFRAGIPFVVDGGVWASPLVGEAKGGLFSRGPSERQEWLTGIIETPESDDFRALAVRDAIGKVTDAAGLAIVTKNGDGAEAKVYGRQRRGNGVGIVDLGRVMFVAGVGGGAKAMGTRVSVSDDGETWRDIRGDLVASVMRPRQPIRTRWLKVTGTNDRIEARVPLVETYSRVERKAIIARRSDGLGGRLAAVLNAIRLARVLGIDFRIGWDDKLADDAFHAVPPAEQVFEPEFWEAHGEHPKWPAPRLRSHGETLTLDRIHDELRAENGLLVPKERLETFIDDESVRGPYGPEFDEIGWAPTLQSAVDAARAATLPARAVGVHVRSGDIVFGPYRRYLVHTRKVIAWPIARAIVEAIEARGDSVVVFGEDAELTAAITAGTNAVTAASLLPFRLDETARALADIVLLSRMDSVVGRDSAFAQQAASLSGAPLTDPSDFFDTATQVRITEDAVHDAVDPLAAAFAYWSAYYHARDDLSPTDARRLLEHAAAADPSNALYAVAIAAQHWRDGDLAGGDAVIEASRAADRPADAVGVAEPGPDAVFVQRMGAWFLLDEFFPAVEAAAASGSAVAASLIARRDEEKAKADEALAG